MNKSHLFCGSPLGRINDRFRQFAGSHEVHCKLKFLLFRRTVKIIIIQGIPAEEAPDQKGKVPRVVSESLEPGEPEEEEEN